jgi:hypothetical protein
MCAEGPQRSRVILAGIGSTPAGKVTVTVEQDQVNERPAPALELTRFRGHLTVGAGGIHDGRQIGPVHTGVQATVGRAGAIGAQPASLSKEFGPSAWTIGLWAK